MNFMFRFLIVMILFLFVTGKDAELDIMLNINWERLPDMHEGFQDSDGGFIDNKLVTVFGYGGGGIAGFKNYGWSIELGEKNKSWEFIPQAPLYPRQEVSAALIDNALYFVGGFSYIPPYCFKDGAVLRYIDNEWQWELLPELPWTISSAGVAASDGILYVMGGYQYNSEGFFTWKSIPGVSPLVERLGARLLTLDVRNKSSGWVEKTSCPGTPRAAHAVVSYNDYLYVFGGYTSELDGNTIDNWKYSIKNDSWERILNLPISSSNFPGGNIVWRNRYVVLIGGYQYGNIAYPNGTVGPLYGVPKHICTLQDSLNFNKTNCWHYCSASLQVKTDEYYNDIFVYDLLLEKFGKAQATSNGDIDLMPHFCGALPMNNNLGQTNIFEDYIFIIGGECDPRTIWNAEKNNMINYGHYPNLALKGTIHLSKPEIK